MIALELFPCSGGLTEGFRRAGITFAASFDKDPDACASHDANLGERPIQVDVRELVRMARVGMLGMKSAGGTHLDLLVADPPCAPWSRAGKRKGLADERDMLVETVDLVDLLRPRAALICNIPGLDDLPHLDVVQRTIGSLAKHGYCIDFARLNYADFGVPQIRHRPFWFLHRGGPHLRWPDRTHCDPDELHQPTLPGMPVLHPWVTCRDALSHLAPEELGRHVRLRKRGCHSDQHGSVPGRPARTVGTSNLLDGNVLLMHDRHPISTPDAPSRTVLTSDGGGAKGHVLAWPWDRPATTVDTKQWLAPHGRNGRDGSSQRHNENAIVLSEKAGAILQGFPASWVFVGKSKRSRWSQIGMAVAPVVAEAVARSIAAQLQANRPSG